MSDPRAATPLARRALLVALAVVAAALALRVSGHLMQSLWIDEAVSSAQSSLPPGDMLAAVAADNYPPLHNIVLAVMIALFGDGELALRLPSVLFGVLTVIAVGRLARDLYGQRAGLAAMGLVALSPIAIYYAQEARPYALFALLAVLSTGALTRAALRPWRSWRPGLAWAGWTALMLYTHYYALFVAFAQALWLGGLLWARRGRPDAPPLARWAALGGLVAAAFAPWLGTFLTRASAVQAGFWIGRPDLDVLRHMAAWWAGWAFPALAALALTALLPRRAAERASDDAVAPWGADERAAAWLIALIVGCSVAIPFVASLVAQPLLIRRYTIAAAVLLPVLAAGGLARLTAGRSASWFAIPAVALVALLAPTALRQQSDAPRPDWRGVAALVGPELAPGDVVAVLPAWQAPALRHYLPAANIADPHVASTDPPEAQLDALDAALAKSDAGGAVWIVALAGAGAAGADVVAAHLDGERVPGPVTTVRAFRLTRWAPRASPRE